MRRTCSIDGCDTPRHARGWCRRHYQAWSYHGDPLYTAPTVTVQQRFLEKVEKSDAPDGCWLWTASRDSRGYGSIYVGGRLRKAHRVAYEMAYGPIPDGRMIDHRCWNKRCCRASHLRLATRQQNGQNRKGATSESASGVRGVFRNHGRWQAKVGHNGVEHYLGTFGTIAEAAEVARLKRLELFTHSDMDRIPVAPGQLQLISATKTVLAGGGG